MAKVPGDRYASAGDLGKAALEAASSCPDPVPAAQSPSTAPAVESTNGDAPTVA